MNVTTAELRIALLQVAAELRETARACSIPPKRGKPEKLIRAAESLESACRDIRAHLAGDEQ